MAAAVLWALRAMTGGEQASVRLHAEGGRGSCQWCVHPRKKQERSSDGSSDGGKDTRMASVSILAVDRAIHEIL